MKNIIVFLIFVVPVFAGSGGDTLVYDANVRNLADGDTFYTALYYHPPFDSIQSIINGRLGNVNFSDSATLDQRKIDSTASNSNDWIYNYTKKIWYWANNIPSIRSARDIKVYLNDTTANTGGLYIYTDSTTLMARIGEDSIVFNLPVKFNNKMVVDSIYGRPLIDSLDVTYLRATDSLVSDKGIRAVANIRGDSILSDKGIRAVANIRGDSIVSDKGIRAVANIRGDSIVSDKGIRATNTVVADSFYTPNSISADGGFFNFLDFNYLDADTIGVDTLNVQQKINICRDSSSTTLAAQAITFTSSLMYVNLNGGDSLKTITGGKTGDMLVVNFLDEESTSPQLVFGGHSSSNISGVEIFSNLEISAVWGGITVMFIRMGDYWYPISKKGTL